MSKNLLVFGCSIATVFAVACGNGTKSPVSPQGAAPGGQTAAEPGVTLKVTAPTLVEPVGGVIVEDLDPDVRWGHSTPLFASATLPLHYDIEVVNEDGQLAYTNTVPQGPGDTTRHELTKDLRDDEVHTWRVRARYDNRVGPWSLFASFKTYIPPSVLPPGPYPSDGFAIAAFVAAHYPEYLVPTQFFSQRTANMHFLRDRMIEVGRCAGVDLALNRKRSGIISDDAITWKFGPVLTPDGGGDVEVVDVALDWDNDATPLKLQWMITHGPAGYTPLPNPQRCR
jgi:hypothetical protein